METNTETIGDAETQQFKDDVTKFTLLFIQALLKTGYYAPDHPVSLQAKTGLYDDFLKILRDRNEFTFVKFAQPDKLDVLIEGLSDEQFSLKSNISGGTADLFIPKFIEFFVRRSLASFSIMRGIPKEAF